MLAVSWHHSTWLNHNELEMVVGIFCYQWIAINTWSVQSDSALVKKQQVLLDIVSIRFEPLATINVHLYDSWSARILFGVSKPCWPRLVLPFVNQFVEARGAGCRKSPKASCRLEEILRVGSQPRWDQPQISSTMVNLTLEVASSGTRMPESWFAMQWWQHGNRSTSHFESLFQ